MEEPLRLESGVHCHEGCAAQAQHGGFLGLPGPQVQVAARVLRGIALAWGKRVLLYVAWSQHSDIFSLHLKLLAFVCAGHEAPNHSYSCSMRNFRAHPVCRQDNLKL